MRDHGGNLDAAIGAFGGAPQEWIDLSTGINRVPWPVPELPRRVWTDLPTRADAARLSQAACEAWGVTGAAIALAGASQAIQLIPHLGPRGRARVLSPTYNEHAASLAAAGWRVEPVGNLAALAGADLAVVVNPNNPDGRSHDPQELLGLLPRVGQLVVDESFADPLPHLSLAGETTLEKLWVLRSFGKFYGLAGLRLGFVLGAPAAVARLAALAGPWPVCGAAVAIGQAALADRAWQQETSERLVADAAWLDVQAPWRLAGGTPLFRLYETGDAVAAQRALAQARIWSRIFPWSSGLIRLGLPAPQERARVARALAQAA